MNERIRELADKATIRGEEYLPGNDGHPTPTTYFDKEKFAELIVRECANAIINDSRLNDVRSAANGCVRTINEHFGVEE